MVRRALGAGRALASVHVELAQQEAAADAGRVGGALGLLAVGVLLVLSALLLVDVALVVSIAEQTTLGWGASALVVAGGHVAVALPLFLLGSSRLKKPLLKRTRGRVKETLAAIRA